MAKPQKGRGKGGGGKGPQKGGKGPQKGKGRSGDRYTRQAAAEAAVRFGPERSQLAALLNDARTNMRQGIADENQAARGYSQAVGIGSPSVKASYKDAESTLLNQNEGLKHDLAGLGAGAEPYRAAIASESAHAQTGLARQLADAMLSLQAQGLRGRDTAQYHIGNLRRGYQKQAGSIGNRMLDVAVRQGQYTGAEADHLRQNAANFAEKAAADKGKLHLGYKKLKSNENVHAADRASRERIAQERAAAKGKGKGKGKPKLTQAKLNAYIGLIEQGVSAARDMKSGKRFRKGGKAPSFSDIRPLLTEGRAKGWAGKDSPPVPKLGDSAFVDAAFEIAQNGSISPRTNRDLQRQGIVLPPKYRPQHKAPKKGLHGVERAAGKGRKTRR